MRRKPKPSKVESNVVVEVIEAARQRRGDEREPADDRVIGLTAFARDMDVSVQAVQKWIMRKEIPPRRVLRAEELSGVPRHRIRGDMYPRARESSTSLAAT